MRRLDPSYKENPDDRPGSGENEYSSDYDLLVNGDNIANKLPTNKYKFDSPRVFDRFNRI